MRTSRLLTRPASRLLFTRLAGFYKKSLKKLVPAEYLEIPTVDSKGRKIPCEEDIEKNFEVKKLTSDKKAPEELYSLKENGPTPIVAKLGPITLHNPEIFSKKYKWCSCGMSAKQVDQTNAAIL